jgi:hypothetical protein
LNVAIGVGKGGGGPRSIGAASGSVAAERVLSRRRASPLPAAGTLAGAGALADVAGFRGPAARFVGFFVTLRRAAAPRFAALCPALAFLPFDAFIARDRCTL